MIILERTIPQAEEFGIKQSRQTRFRLRKTGDSGELRSTFSFDLRFSTTSSLYNPLKFLIIGRPEMIEVPRKLLLTDHYLISFSNAKTEIIL